MKCPPDESARNSSCAAFSLLELLIAIAVLTISLVPALQSSIGSQRLNAQAEETQVALAALEAARLLIHESTPQDLSEVGGDFEVGQAIAVNTILDGALLTYDLPNWAPGDALPDVLSFRVTVSWTSAMRQPRSIFLMDAIR